MPSVDIPTPSQPSTGGSKGGFGTGIPTPLLLIAVGGGLGLIVFLTKKSGSGSSTDPSKSTLLPNTAIMLGSLQQGVLDLQGQVSTGNADLSSQLTGVGENLGMSIDANSAATQKAFADLSTYLGTNFKNIGASETAISTAIAGLGTQNAGLADSLAQVLTNMKALQTGVSDLNAGNVDLLSGINAVYNNQNTLQTSLNTLGDNLGAEILAINQGLGGSIGTTKGELGTLAVSLGVGNQVKQYLVSHGDYSMGH